MKPKPKPRSVWIPPSETLLWIRDSLCYRDGRLYWTKKVASHVGAGRVAGCQKTGGYLQVRIGGKSYLGHRIIWYLCHGEWPAMSIDHKNGVTSDNRIENLRLATWSQNNWNNRRTAGASGVKGAWYNPKKKSYVTRIKVNGKEKYIGSFKSVREAASARAAAEAKHFGEYAPISCEVLPKKRKAKVKR